MKSFNEFIPLVVMLVFMAFIMKSMRKMIEKGRKEAEKNALQEKNTGQGQGPQVETAWDGEAEEIEGNSVETAGVEAVSLETGAGELPTMQSPAAPAQRVHKAPMESRIKIAERPLPAREEKVLPQLREKKKVRWIPGKAEARRAVILSEILGKPRAENPF